MSTEKGKSTGEATVSVNSMSGQKCTSQQAKHREH